MYGEDTPAEAGAVVPVAERGGLHRALQQSAVGLYPAPADALSDDHGLLSTAVRGEAGLRVGRSVRTSFPSIFGIEFDDTLAEEAFSVYDHPEVRLYRKTADYSEALVRSYLDPIDLENTILMWPKQVSAAPTALL